MAADRQRGDGGSSRVPYNYACIDGNGRDMSRPLESFRP